MKPPQPPEQPSSEPEVPYLTPGNFSPGNQIQPSVITPTSPAPAIYPSDNIDVQPSGQFSSPPQVTTPAVAPVFNTPLSPAPASPSIQLPRRRNRRKLLAILVSSIVLLGGASAAAYFDYYVPNKPENVLLSALENTASRKQVRTRGSLNFDQLDETSGASTLSTKINMTSQTDTSKNVAQLDLDLVVSGVKVSGELRYVDNNLYFQLYNLEDVKSLVDISVAEPEIQAPAKQLLSKFSNQWIVIDSTILKEAKFTCALSTIFPSRQDFKTLEQTYKKTPFAAITSTAQEKIEGKNTTRYELAVDDNKFADYISANKNSSYLKNLAGCFGSDASQLKAGSLRDNDKTPITIWVDKSKKLVSKVALHSTEQDKSKDHIKSNLALVFTYGNVSVAKPDNAKSIVQLISELGSDATDWLGGFTSVFGGSDGTDSSTQSDIQQKARDTERKTDIAALQGQIEAYQAQNGRYPTLANLNSSAFRTANLKGLDPQALQDPKSTTKTMLAAPAANGYAYQVTPAGCDNAAKGDCTQYTITATLEGGGTYVKQSLN